MFRMKTNHTEENKIWRLIRNLSIILIIMALILFSIILISGKIPKLENQNSISLTAPSISFTVIDNDTAYQEQQMDWKKEDIESIAQDIAKSHKYKLNEFDCTDFTKSLVGNLTKEGYEARCIIGYKKQNPKQVFHAWTEVNLSGELIWIESTTGEIVTEENEPYYKPLKGYKKYQCY